LKWLFLGNKIQPTYGMKVVTEAFQKSYQACDNIMLLCENEKIKQV
jgi:hypothetical protein